MEGAETGDDQMMTRVSDDFPSAANPHCNGFGDDDHMYEYLSDLILVSEATLQCTTL